MSVFFNLLMACPMLVSLCQFLILSQLTNGMLIEKIFNSNSVTFFFLSCVWTASGLVDEYAFRIPEVSVLFADLPLL